MDLDHHFMKLALKEAQKALKKEEVPVGAVLVYQDKVISKGHNTRETKQISLNHAELLCIQSACKKLNTWRLEDCVLYVTLEPCPMCAGAIMQSRIKRVVFGAYDKKGGSYGSSFNINEIPTLNHYPEITSGILEKECSEIISNFFKERRKQNKKKADEIE